MAVFWRSSETFFDNLYLLVGKVKGTEVTVKGEKA